MNIFVETKGENVRNLTYVYVLVSRCIREVKISKTVRCDYICCLTEYFMRSTNTHENDNDFLPPWSFDSIRMWQNVWDRARAWDKNTPSWKDERERKIVADYIHIHVTCLEPCVVIWESEEWESELSKV